jgi:uncharacterized protein (TIGR03382 family)
MFRRLAFISILVMAIAAPAVAGDGCTEAMTPGCGGCSCESCVCGLDPYCCDTAWDSLCVDACQNSCGGCGGGGGGGACGAVSYEGCCQGQVVLFCEGGTLQQLDCSANPSCGWSAEGGYYDCGTLGSGDPSGLHPFACGGGTNPYCGNGICEAGENASTCPSDCGGGTNPYCGNGVCEAGENASTCPQDCGGGCTPSCQNKNCGDDGCGGSCGTCPSPGFCNWEGQCESLCTTTCQSPNGTTKECGPDGCGGQCGACGIGQVCDEAAGTCGNDPGVCVEDCMGKQCGPDGCGDVCGECPYELACSVDGLCVDPSDPGVCTPDCTVVVCGDDGCGGSCGVCPDGTFCNDTGLCEPGVGPDGGVDGDPYSSECPPGTSLLYGKCIATGAEDEAGGGEGCGAGPGSVPLWALLFLALAARLRRLSPARR